MVAPSRQRPDGVRSTIHTHTWPCTCRSLIRACLHNHLRSLRSARAEAVHLPGGLEAGGRGELAEGQGEGFGDRFRAGGISGRSGAERGNGETFGGGGGTDLRHLRARRKQLALGPGCGAKRGNVRVCGPPSPHSPLCGCSCSKKSPRWHIPSQMAKDARSGACATYAGRAGVDVCMPTCKQIFRSTCS